MNVDFLFLLLKNNKKKILKKLQKKLFFEPTTTPNTLFVFPQQIFQHSPPPLSARLPNTAKKIIV